VAKPIRKPLSELLVARLQAEGFLPGGTYRVERLYPGYWQRKEGAWSWTALDSEDREVFVGSQFTMTEMLRAPGIIQGNDGGLYPEPNDPEHRADWSDWGPDHPDEGPSCKCGFNGSPEECAAYRKTTDSESK